MIPRIYPKKPSRIPYTPEGFRKMEEEREELRARRPHAVEELRKAREMGDLSENGYYKAARSELSFLDKRLRLLDRLSKSALVIERTQNGRIDIGSNVIIEKDGLQVSYTIVGGYESDPSQGTISYRSPIGSRLMGRTVGDECIVTVPAGTVRLKVLEVR